MPVESKEQELTRVLRDGGEAEKLMMHPLIDGFFSKEIEDVFNSFCNLRPGVSHEAYLRLHLEVHSLLNLKAKLLAYVTEKAHALDRERFDKTQYAEMET